MLDEAVPCVNATLYEFNRGLHMTREDSKVCPRCVRTLDILNTRRSQAEEYDGEFA